MRGNGRTLGSLIRRAVSACLCAALLFALVPAQAASYTGKLNCDGVRLRKKASTSSDYIAKYDSGTQVTLVDESGDFFYVTVGTKTGYILKRCVTVSSSTLKKFEASLKDRSKYASVTSISKLGEAPGSTEKGDSGDDVEKLQQALKIKGYYTGTVDGEYGAGTRDAVRAYQKAAGLTVDGKAGYNTILKLFGKVSETTVESDPRMNGITRISQIDTPATSKKGDSGSKVTALQQALKIKGYYAAPIDGAYGDKTYAAVIAYQKAVGLSKDGVAGNATIKKLFGENAANYSYTTERLDWFNGGASVIPKGATFTVKDVETGKTFTVKRWSGANHLDGEPYTAEDTKTMKSIYGGDWSWTRRAILVKYDGHVYAASMNGMPHGTTTISNNDFDGHFCIHFYKSRTHETNVVNSEHQNMVAKAMKATW